MSANDHTPAQRQWIADHPRHWWALQRMEEGEFKDSLLQAAQKGFMTMRQMAYLWHVANKLEREARGESTHAPVKGSRDTFHVIVTRAEWGDNKFGDHVFRVDFLSLNGWRGRWETTNEGHVKAVENRTTDEMFLTATVKWSREDYGILGGRVTIRFASE